MCPGAPLASSRPLELVEVDVCCCWMDEGSSGGAVKILKVEKSQRKFWSAVIWWYVCVCCFTGCVKAECKIYRNIYLN